MKKIAFISILNFLVLCSLAQIHRDITVSQADSLITANSAKSNFNILDVRTYNEYAGGHVQNAISIDYYSLTFGIQLDSLNKNDIYLVHCKSGSRSAKAIDTMQVLGFNYTYNMLGGMDAWITAGYQTVTHIIDFYDLSIKVEIYPNPASDFVTLVIDRNIKADLILNIYNIMGYLVKRELLNHNQQQINVGDLSNGIYMVEIKSKGLIGKQKLIVKR